MRLKAVLDKNCYEALCVPSDVYSIMCYASGRISACIAEVYAKKKGKRTFENSRHILYLIVHWLRVMTSSPNVKNSPCSVLIATYLGEVYIDLRTSK